MRRLLAFVLLTLPLAAQAAPFDPEAATRAYLATLNGAARAKSDAYFEGGYWLILWGALVGIAVDLTILQSGFSARFRDWAERTSKRRALQTALYTWPYLLAGALIALPWTIYTGFIRERQYDLMNQSFAEWAVDQAKGLGLDMIFTPLLAMAIFGVIRRSPKRWWLWCAGVLTGFFTLGVLIAPVFLAPLFNSYTELQTGPVRDRIVAMAQSRDVPADHIYVFDASRQTKRISANVSGLGPTIRISLNDNLLNRTTLPEQASVMGHEMGHYVLGHVKRGIAFYTAIFLVAFWLLYRLTPAIVARYGARWGVRGPDDVAAIPIYSILFTSIFLILTPVTNTIVRTAESEADAFGLDVAHEPDGFALTALKLSEYRKLEPSALEEMIFYDHPSGRTRIRMAMDWKAKHFASLSPPFVPSEVEGQARSGVSTSPFGRSLSRAPALQAVEGRDTNGSVQK